MLTGGPRIAFFEADCTDWSEEDDAENRDAFRRAQNNHSTHRPNAGRALDRRADTDQRE